MSKLAVKKNFSSLQVLKTLKILLQDDYSMGELIAKLNSEEDKEVFNSSIISKYINTCRLCGIEISKINNKYFVSNMPFGLELVHDDIMLLEAIQNIIRNSMSKKCNKIFDTFLTKINRFSNKKLTRVEKSTYYISVEHFESAIDEKRKIRLMLKNKDVVDCIPIRIAEDKDRIFFHILYNNKERAVDASRVSGIEVLNEKYIQKFSKQVVVFKLKGELAPRYTLRYNEHVVEHYNGDYVVISNQDESKDILFSRLLRYGDKCEILNPKSYREEMQQILDMALSNYDE